MSRRRSEEEESSLELLLDTMCNTFGGVMFIAISIFVIISGMSQIEQATVPEKDIPDPQMLQRQITELNTFLQNLERTIQSKNEEMLQRKQIDQTDIINQIALMEQKIKALNAREKAVKTAQQLVNKNLQKTRTVLDSAQQIRAKKEQQKRDLEKELTELRREYRKLRHQRAARRKMVFRNIAPSSLAPYFIIIDGSQAYTVGPFNAVVGKDGFQFASGCIAQQYIGKQGNINAVCRIKPGHGINILNGNTLSADFQNMLRNIPSDRVPKFYIMPNSTGTVYKMREIMKANNIMHGISLANENGSALDIITSENVHYEY